MTVVRCLLVLGVIMMLTGVAMRPGRLAAQSGPDLLTNAGVAATPNDCSFLIKGRDDPRARLGDIACGTVDVPENWSEPEGRRLQISYVILKSTGAQPEPDPVIHLGGGPGISPLTFAESWAGVFSVLRQDRDVILFDQRGTRLSSPLRCEAQSAALAADAPAEAAGITPALPAYPAEISDPDALLAEARTTYGPLAEACAQQVLATGVDLTQYNTLANANDVAALVQALGLEAYNLYGISYGTRLALEVMRTHPERGLRSVVLDSTYPPEIPSYEQFPQEPHEAVIHLFADCARDAACNAAYPDLKARFVAVLSRLRTEPVIAEDGTAITDRDLLAVMQSLGGNIPAVPYVPRMIAELEQGSVETYLGITTGALLAPAPADLDTGDMGASRVATPGGDILEGFSPARRFVLAVQASLDARAGGDESATLPLLLELEATAPLRQDLAAYIDRVLPGAEHMEARSALLTIIESMSDADLQEIPAMATQAVTLASLQITGQSVPMYYAVECNERIPFQSFAAMVANAQHLEIPNLALGVPESFVKVFAICEAWPSDQAPAETQDAVWSDVPVLVLAGAYDNLTPVSWNKSAFVSLPSATFVLAPMAGHGVLAYSACAQEIGKAFIDDPAATPDTQCIADLAPEWAMSAT